MLFSGFITAFFLVSACGHAPTDAGVEERGEVLWDDIVEDDYDLPTEEEEVKTDPVMMDEKEDEGDAMMQEGESAPEQDPEPPEQEAVAPPVQRVITVDARDFAFSPAAITVKKGENVMLRLNNVEGLHGLRIPDMGLNLTVDEPSATLDTSVPGQYAFRCSVPCGSGHKDMRGMIVVEE